MDRSSSPSDIQVDVAGVSYLIHLHCFEAEAVAISQPDFHIRPAIDARGRSYPVVRLHIAHLPLSARTFLVPDRIRVIAPFSFAGSVNLESIRFDENPQIEILNGFEGCGLRELRVPPTVIAIDQDAFAECRFLDSITFERSAQIRIIDGFRGCSITSIEIPRSVETIGPNGFAEWLYVLL